MRKENIIRIEDLIKRKWLNIHYKKPLNFGILILSFYSASLFCIINSSNIIQAQTTDDSCRDLLKNVKSEEKNVDKIQNNINKEKTKLLRLNNAYNKKLEKQAEKRSKLIEAAGGIPVLCRNNSSTISSNLTTCANNPNSLSNKLKKVDQDTASIKSDYTAQKNIINLSLNRFSKQLKRANSKLKAAREDAEGCE